MAENVTNGVIGSQDVGFGYGSFTQTVWGTPISFNKINLSDLYASYAVAFSATPVFDLQNGQVQTITLTNNITSSTIVNGVSTVPTGARIVLRLIQDGTGSRTFGWPANVSGSGAFSISNIAASVTMAELQFNGTNWEFVSIPLVVSSGVITGNVVTASGTAIYLPKFSAASVLVNSDFTDNGSGNFIYKHNSAGDTSGWVANETDGAASRAVFLVGGNPTTPDNIGILLISQKASNVSNGWNLSGVVLTGSGSTNGLVLSTLAGPIKFQPAGSTTQGAFFHSSTGASSYYNFELGTTSGSGTDGNPFSILRQVNTSVDVNVTNGTIGTLSRTSYHATAGGGADIYLAVTSSGYTPAGGVGASTGFIFTGAFTTGGMVIQTSSGNINFQVAGTTSIGTMTIREMRMTGRFRAMALNRVSPTSGSSIDLYQDTTGGGGGSGVLASATWGASEAATVMLPVNIAGNQVSIYTGANYAAITPAVIIGPGVQVGAPTAGDKGAGTINVSVGVYLNNSAFVNPDFVFEHHYTGRIQKFKDNPGAARYLGLMPLEDVELFARENYQLPRVGGVQELFGRADMTLEKIEELFLYMFDQNQRIKALERLCSLTGLPV